MKFRKFIQLFVKSLKLIVEYKKTMPIVYLLYYIFVAIIPVVSIVANQQVLNAIQKNGTFDTAFIWLLTYLFFLIMGALLENYFLLYEEANSKMFDIFLEDKNLRKIHSLSLADFEDSRTYDLIERAEEHGGVKIIEFMKRGMNFIKAILVLISTLYLFSRYSYWMIILIVGIPIVKFCVLNKINEKQFEIYCDRTHTERLIDYFRYITYKGLAFKEFLIFNAQNYVTRKILDLKNDINRMDISIFKKYVILISIVDFFETISIGGIFLKFIKDAFEHKILLGDVSLLWSCINQIKININELLNIANQTLKETMYIDFYFQFVDIAVKNEDKLGIKIDSIETIEFKNVYYKNRRSGKYILKDINFLSKKGDFVLIKGNNGTGKTTLIRLILGLYDDYDGKILINNVDLKKIDIKDYWKCVSAVFQDFFKYEVSVLENIKMDSKMDDDDVDKIQKISSMMNIGSLFDDLKYSDVLGDWFGGKQLSIGQWQKISILRSLYKEADLYVFDESDSALDEESKITMYRGIREYKGDKIIFVISHRFASDEFEYDKLIILD